MNEAAKTTLTEQLRSEARRCRQCRYLVTNPFYELCPRCNAVLPKLELFCNGCLHKSVCPALAGSEGDGERAGKDHESGETHETRTRKSNEVL